MILETLQKYNLVPSNIDLEEYLTDGGNINLYDLIKKNKGALKEMELYINKKDDIRRRMLRMIYDNNFLPIDCLKWIENNNNYIYTNKRIHIVDNKPIDKELIYHVNKIVKWIASIAEQSPDIEIWIFLCPHKKVLPKEKKPLGRNEVNSGVTLLGSWVQVFRSEEVLKVLIHELLHYYELEIREEAEKIQRELNIDMLLNEAYNELFAIYLHTLYYSKVYNKDFWECLNKEIKYSEGMFRKIVQYYDMKEWDDFFGDKFKTKTNVFSYYILKYLLMEHLYLLQVPNMRDIKRIRSVMKDIVRNHKLDVKGYIGNNSLRMSCLDIISS